MKRLSVFLLTIALVISFSLPAFACDENQTNTYVLQILFGDQASNYESDTQVKTLLNALYLCSEQSDGLGQNKLTQLKSNGVRLLPSLSDINVSSDELMACSHNVWEYQYSPAKKEQSNRKKVLQRTVNKVFDFGFLSNVFNSSSGKNNSLSALLYYSHILSDYLADDPDSTKTTVKGQTVSSYSGQPYIELNGNKPSFTYSQKKRTTAFSSYSSLDSLGRCGVAFSCIGPDELSAVTSRQHIGNIKPSGWDFSKYPGVVNSYPAYLYNRCHLIAHQLSNRDTADNLITGTRYLNETGMKPFENMVAAYINSTDNHVLYRATPIFEGDNLVASGVQLEGYSVEDNGEGICFNVYCYNVQPGVTINYASGTNESADDLYDANGVIPFAVSNPSDSNQDLIYAMCKHLEILFKDQKSTGNYISMMSEINTIANEARVVGDKGETAAQCYIALKAYEYKVFNVLKNYVPFLLQEEEFFNSIFN